MKTSGSMIGGSLAPQWHASYSLYFEKFIEAYAAEGLAIDAISLQNEPLFIPGNYPGTGMSASQQADLIRNHFGPRFAASGIKTKILAYDHNWDITAYPLEVSTIRRRTVRGRIGLPRLRRKRRGPSDVQNAIPTRASTSLEFSGGDWAPNFANNLVSFARTSSSAARETGPRTCCSGTSRWTKTTGRTMAAARIAAA